MKAFFSFYSDALKIALQSIFAHKLRAFLTLIGIIIGVASVVTVGASISGLNTYVVDKIAKVLGSNHFMIARMAFHGRLSDDEFERRNRRNKTTELGRLRVGARSLRLLRRSRSPVEQRHRSEAGRHRVSGASVFGSSPTWWTSKTRPSKTGRFISPDEVERSALVCRSGRRH